MAGIKGLPGYQWVYKGKANPYTQEIAKARYAYNPLTGDKLTYRAAYTRAHGGVSHEKRVPQEQRKRYTRKEGKYNRHGPFTSFDDVRQSMKHLPKSADVVMRVYGKTKKREEPKGPQRKGKRKKKGSGEGVKMYMTVTPIMDWSAMQRNMTRIDQGGAATNPIEERIDRNLAQFENIERFYLLVKGE